MESAAATNVVFIVGVGLLILSGLSAAALFWASLISSKPLEGSKAATLWALFLIGLVVGLVSVQ